ncbi:RNA polymerase II degradation factor 1-like [Trichoplusia ni]|uniref:RNA polymerase II degradation factor 1-like n=1 Tax=Trichoplusia ni TaxID=7111 RepID=A0A7E5VN94_TRINI|nr:RNA polymerase II degradation factor 1-like [Trichoplusia ni]
MLRFVLVAAVVAIASSAPQNNFIFKNDITPEEAQQYLKSLPFTSPSLSGRTAVLPLVRYDDPRFRAADAGPTLGHYWKNGQEIQNTDDYVEEVYNAAQYHGQDGLGQYAYGYETPESSKVENREGSGVVSGSYVYKAGSSNDLIKVRYWADSEGFHQEDNIPKVELKPAEETPALREARLAFEKAWKEAAEANSKAPTVPPPAGNYNNNYNQYQPYEAQASELNGVVVSAEQPREGKNLAYAQAQNGAYNQGGQQYGQQQQFGQQQQYGQQQQQPQYGQQQQQQQYGQQKQYGQQETEEGKYEEPEPTGPPHGFFYSFTYPVSIIVPKKDLNADGYPVDHDTVGVNGQ